MAAATASLRSEPAFVQWALAEGVSMFGSAVTTVVLPLVVYQATGSAATTGALFAMRVVPYLLLGMVAGPVADRGNRRRLIIGGNLIEGGVGGDDPDRPRRRGADRHPGVRGRPAVGDCVRVLGRRRVRRRAGAGGHRPCGRSQRPDVDLAVGGRHAGPVVAGVLVATLGATTAIWIDACSFVFAAAVQSAIKAPFRPVDAGPVAGGGLRATASEAITFIRRNRTLLVLVVGGFFNSAAFGIVLGLLVPYAVEQIWIPADDGRIGLLYGSLGVGSLGAGLVFAKLFGADRIRLLTPGSIAVSSMLAASLALNEAWAPAVVLAAAFSSSITTTIVVGITYRQIAAPDRLRSSVNAIGRMVSWGGQPFGAAVGALLVTSTTVRNAYVVAAAIMAAAAVATTLALRSE